MATEETEKLLPSNSDENENISLLKEMCGLIKLAIPICLSLLVELIPDLTALIYVGNLSDADVLLSSLGLSRTLYILVLVYLCGVSQAIDTLIPQAIGAQKKHLIALYMQRAFWMTLIASIPSFLLLFYGEAILRLCVDSADIDYELVRGQCRYFILTTYLYTWYVILAMLANAMGITTQTQLFFCCVVGSGLSYPFSLLFITKLEMGSYGYPLVIAACLSVTISLVLIFVYYRNGLLYVFRPVSLYEIFAWDGIREYIYLCAPNTVNGIFGILFSDFAMIYCLWVQTPNIAVSAAVIIASIRYIIVFIGLSGQYALSIKIGIYVGANMIDKAKMAVQSGQIVTLAVGVLIFIVLISAREALPRIYTSNAEIISLASQLMYVLMISQLFNLGLCAMNGIFLGLGKPIYPSIITIASYISLSLPLMFILLFGLDLKESMLWGTVSIFATLSVGYAISCFVLELHLLFKLDWNTVLSQSRYRLAEKSESDAHKYEPV